MVNYLNVFLVWALFRFSTESSDLFRIPFCFSFRWMTLNDELAFEDPGFFCEKCYRYLHYAPDGRKLSSFEAYPYIEEDWKPPSNRTFGMKLRTFWNAVIHNSNRQNSKWGKASAIQYLLQYRACVTEGRGHCSYFLLRGIEKYSFDEIFYQSAGQVTLLNCFFLKTINGK